MSEKDNYEGIFVEGPLGRRKRHKLVIRNGSGRPWLILDEHPELIKMLQRGQVFPALIRKLKQMGKVPRSKPGTWSKSIKVGDERKVVKKVRRRPAFPNSTVAIVYRLIGMCQQ